MTQRKLQYGRRPRNPLLPMSVYGERAEKVNHKLSSQQLSRKDYVSISRLRNGHHPDLKYCLDTVFRKCGMGKVTVEHEMVECPRINHPTAQRTEPYLIATNHNKALEMWKLWKGKPDLPGILQPGQLV